MRRRASLPTAKMPFTLCPTLRKLFVCKRTSRTPPFTQNVSHSPYQDPSLYQQPIPSDPPPAYTLLPHTPSEPIEAIETLEEIQARRARQRDEVLASERYIRQNTKTCPRCHMAVEKTEGCDHMTCTFSSPFTSIPRLPNTLKPTPMFKFKIQHSKLGLMEMQK